MKASRLLALLLAVIMAASTVVMLNSCGETEKTDETTAAVTVADATTEAVEDTTPQKDEWGRDVVEDDVPTDLNYSGQTLKILARSDANNRWSIDFYAKEETGVKVNDAVYKRNEAIKERLGIEIEVTEKAGSYTEYTEYLSNIQKSVDSGDHAYDVVGTYSLFGAEYATQGYYKNVYDLKYINLEQVWWNKEIKNDLTVGNKLYFLVGDMNLTTLTRMLVMYFNKTLVKDGLNDVNLYSVVQDGKWTLEYVTELIANTYADSNGSGSADIGDTFGIVSVSPSEAFDGLQASTDFHFLVRDSSGNWSLNENTDRLFDIIEKISAMYHKGNNTSKFMTINECLEKFSGDTAYLMIMTLDKCGEEYLLNMKSEYGILPLPKYNEEQSNYYTLPQDAFNLISVVVDTENPDMVSAALELMSAGSYKSVTPVYFDDVLKYRYMSDSESGAMLDILREGLRFDFATINTLSVNDCGRWIRTALTGDTMASSTKVSSTYNVTKKKVNSELKEFLEAYEALEH